MEKFDNELFEKIKEESKKYERKNKGLIFICIDEDDNGKAHVSGDPTQNAMAIYHVSRIMKRQGMNPVKMFERLLQMAKEDEEEE